MTPTCCFFAVVFAAGFFVAPSATLPSDNDGLNRINALSRLVERQTGSQTCVCGVGKRKRIVNGTPAEINAYPWMVGVFWSTGELFCGGAIINSKYILSASHCFPGVNAVDIFTVLGDYDRSKSTEVVSEQMGIDKIYIHEQYGVGVPAKVNNDVALLRTKRAIEFRDNIQPICLPPPNTDYTGEVGIAAGWGTTKFGGQGSQILLEVDLPILSNNICKANFTANYLPDTMMCAGYLKAGKDACQGDSGGPLFLEDASNVYDVVGVISYGRGCATPGYPGVYTRVTAFLPWIEEKTKDAVKCSRPTKPPPVKRECGKGNNVVGKRAVGGMETGRNQYPWTAALILKNNNRFELRCGATLISNEWLITTARCVNGILTSSLSVLLGDHNIQVLEQVEVHSSISSMVIHPNFVATDGITSDLALIKLNSPVAFNKFVSPVCLPPVSWGSFTFEGIEGVATGWGWINDAGKMPSIQQQVFLKIITNKQCQLVYGSAIKNFVLCAGTVAGENICDKDFGGQFSITDADGVYQLVGTSSFIHGRGCAFAAPAGFMRITEFLTWINGVTKIPLVQ